MEDVQETDQENLETRWHQFVAKQSVASGISLRLQLYISEKKIIVKCKMVNEARNLNKLHAAVIDLFWFNVLQRRIVWKENVKDEFTSVIYNHCLKHFQICLGLMLKSYIVNFFWRNLLWTYILHLSSVYPHPGIEELICQIRHQPSWCKYPTIPLHHLEEYAHVRKVFMVWQAPSNWKTLSIFIDNNHWCQEKVVTGCTVIGINTDTVSGKFKDHFFLCIWTSEGSDFTRNGSTTFWDSERHTSLAVSQYFADVGGIAHSNASPLLKFFMVSGVNFLELWLRKETYILKTMKTK